jgi:hypothetical protein
MVCKLNFLETPITNKKKNQKYVPRHRVPWVEQFALKRVDPSIKGFDLTNFKGQLRSAREHLSLSLLV